MDHVGACGWCSVHAQLAVCGRCSMLDHVGACGWRSVHAQLAVRGWCSVYAQLAVCGCAVDAVC